MTMVPLRKAHAYRIFPISGASMIPVTTLHFPDDAAAVRHAMQFLDGVGVEVWDGPRLVARLDHCARPDS